MSEVIAVTVASAGAATREQGLPALLRQLPATPDVAHWNWLLEDANAVCAAAFQSPHTAQGKAADLQLHQALYMLHAWRVASPWTPGWRNVDDWRFAQLRETLEKAWLDSEAAWIDRHLDDLPQVASFREWAEALCQEHRSNVSHPLFAFLRDDATLAQLREFIIQETPFDIHFGDILALMLPGVYGGYKAELATNFWDEMGRGDAALMHRQLRLDMTGVLGVDDMVYLHDVERFCVEELRLANMYFHAACNRAELPQAIGMLMATELMVPGRLDQQIMGWRRVGFAEASMKYLLEHTVVDVVHAHGWMDKVVMPLLHARPGTLPSMARGMVRRLEYAADVCDAMLCRLPEVHE